MLADEEVLRGSIYNIATGFSKRALQKTRITSHFDSKPVQLSHAAKYVALRNFDCEKEYFEFEIKNGITPQDLRETTRLPFETSITLENRKLIFRTGEAETVAAPTKYFESSPPPSFYFHSHPYIPTKPASIQLSASDIIITSKPHRPDFRWMLAHQAGLVIYRRPFINADTQALTSADPLVLLCNYLHDRNLKLYELNLAQTRQILTGFCKDSGMIVTEAKWEDKAKLDELVRSFFKKR